MEFIPLNSYRDLQKIVDEKFFLLFVKKGTPNSDCALKNLYSIEKGKVYTVDVSVIKDIHEKFGVNSVPSFVVVDKSQVKNIIKGCQSTSYYNQIINEKVIKYTTDSTQKPQKRVTVYSTPTCQFCNKLKSYFNKHGIRYTDINVAANQQVAQEMARKSGQRGVPQTEINGQIIVGFDTQKLSKILNIPTE